MVKSLGWKRISLGIIVVALLLFPFISESRTLTILLTQIFIFAILAMSYDILLGYTGIVSFGHAMFFGIGAYSTAIMLKNLEPTMTYFILSIIIGIILAGLISFVIGLLTLRLQCHFFAMFTFA